MVPNPSKHPDLAPNPSQHPYIYRVFGWNRNRKPGIGTKKGSFRQNFSWNAYFCSVFVEKGVIMFSLCLYSHRDRKPRHTGPPQKGPFQDQFFTKNGHFWPPRTLIHPNTSLTVFGWNRNPLLSLHSSVKWFFAIFQNSQKWLIVPIPAKQFGWNRNFWPKMAIFQLFKKEQKISFRLLYKYKIMVPIPTKHR